MSVDSALLDEIKDQLQADILHFGWLCQVVRLKNSHQTEAERIDVVVNAIIELHREGVIVVGCVKESDGLVLIDSWKERDHALRARIESAIAKSDEREREFCVWIQLAEHAAREQ